MVNLLLPRQIDNDYRGYRLAVWLLGLLVLMKLGMGLNVIFNGYEVATSADGIPLDTYAPAAARAVLSFFAIWGLGQVMFGLLGVLALVRYRAMIPVVFALLLLEHLSRKLIFYFLPIARTATPTASIVNVVFLAIMILGLALSLRGRRRLHQEVAPLR